MHEDYIKRKMSEKELSFWARYAEKVSKHGLISHAGEWTIRRAQQFVYGLEGRRLMEVDATYLDHFLEGLGRNGSLQDWQMAQTITALKILLVDTVKLSWSTHYDWEGQFAACADLNSSHPTPARDFSLKMQV